MKPAAQVIEDLEWLDDQRVGAVEAAQRVGFSNAHAMEKWLTRHDAYDLWLSMKRRDPAGTHLSGSDRKRNAMTEIATHPMTALLDEADESGVTKHRRKAEKIRALLAELKADLAADREKREAQAEARAEVERLQAELAAAKDRLRGARDAKPVRVGPPASEVRAWAVANNVACPTTGRVPGAVVDAYLAAHEQAAS